MRPVDAQRDERIERLIMEQAALFARALSESANEAPDGKVLAIAERVAVEQGREFVRKALAITLQGQAAAAEKRGYLLAAADVAVAGTTKASPRKSC